MRNISVLLAGAAFIAFTGLASAQSPAQQTPATSPSQTMQKPGGADGGLEPDDSSKSGRTNPAMKSDAPAGTTGAGVKNEPVQGSGQAAPGGGAQGGSAAAPSVKPNEPARSNP